MKKIIICILMSLPFFVNAQKIKVDSKTHQVTIDGVNSFKIDRTGCGWGVDCYFEVYDIDSNKIMRINLKSFKSPMEKSSYNTDGSITYFEFIFLATKTKAEVDLFALKEEKVAKYILKNNLIVNGKLNDKAVEEFILVNGTEFSERAKRNK